ncbi:MAG: LVIVD repeat-containing protein [Candidatus Heimdallarchaeota archaeon]
MFQKNKNKTFVFFVILLLIIVNAYLNNIQTKISSLDIKNNSNEFLNKSANASSEQVIFSLSKIYQFDNQLGAMNDIVIQDNLAYVAVRWGGLVIFDISDLTNPVNIGSYYEPVNTTSVSDTVLTSGIFVKDDVAFIADGENGLLIVNISNPSIPTKIGDYREESEWKHCYHIFVENNFAYLGTGLYLIILDVSNLTSPEKILEKEYFGIKGLQVKNEILVLTFSSSSIIIDASNLLNLTVITTLFDTIAFEIRNKCLFTIKKPYRLIIFNLTIYPTPSVITNYSLSINGAAEYLCTNDKYIYVGSTEEIIILDIQEISAPQNISKISGLNWYYEEDSIWIKRKLVTLYDVAKNDILLFIDYQRGLFIHKTSNAPGNTLLGYYEGGMRTELIRVKGKFLYVTSRVEFPYYPARLEIFVIRRDSLIKISTYYTNFNINDVVIGDGVVFLVAAGGIEVVDINDPKNPTKISNYYYPEPTFVWNIYYDSQQKIIYLCCDIEGLVILDATNLQNLTVLSVIKDFHGYSYRAYDIYISNGVAFIADVQMFGGFGIIDVSDPSNSSLITYMPLNHAITGIYAKENLVYLTSSARVLEIFNVTSLTEPVKIGEYDENEHGDSNGHFFLFEDIYYVARKASFTLVNVSNPIVPQEIITINRPLSALYIDVFVANSLLYVACAWDGIEVWQLPVRSMSALEILLYTIYSVFIFAMFLTVIFAVFRKKKEI